MSKWQKRQGIMLCQPLTKRALERNFKESDTLLVQPKLDGQRAWVEYSQEDGSPLLVSSQGNYILGVPHIELALKEMGQIIGFNFPWDGELYTHGLPFEQIVSMTKRSRENRHPDSPIIQYHIFDYKLDEVQKTRAFYIKKAFEIWKRRSDPLFTDCLQLVQTEKAYNEADVQKWADIFVEQGYEGIIIRNPKAVYVEKRPYTILKWKPSRADWYEIIGVEEAFTEDGFPKGELGALVCQDRYGNQFKVGSGLGIDQQKKEQYWLMREELVGKFAKVVYQNLTTGNEVPRFGKFVNISVVAENGEREGE